MFVYSEGYNLNWNFMFIARDIIAVSQIMGRHVNPWLTTNLQQTRPIIDRIDWHEQHHAVKLWIFNELNK